MLLAINTMVTVTSLCVFLIVVILLVVILLVAKRYLVASGNVKVTMNGEKTLEIASGGSLLNASTPLPCKRDGRGMVVVASRSHLNDATQQFINDLASRHGDISTVSKGSSLKFCLVAEGNADGQTNAGDKVLLCTHENPPMRILCNQYTQLGGLSRYSWLMRVKFWQRKYAHPLAI